MSKSKRKALFESTALAGFLVAAGYQANAADLQLDSVNTPVIDDVSLPAVSGVNGKIAGALGVLDDDFLGLVMGAVSVPLGHSFGAQLDGLAATADGDFSGGVAGHLFWRDPSVGLIGAYGSYASVDRDRTNEVGRVAAEGQIYWDKITVTGLAGVEFGDVSTEFSGLVDLSFYASENFRIHAGYSRQLNDNIGLIGFEYAPGFGGSSNYSVFGEGIVSGDNDYAAFGGVRFYFGPDKSLIRRHREDDPFLLLPPDLLLEILENLRAEPPED